MTTLVKCSFCDKSQDEVKRITVTDRKGVAICNECVELIVEMNEDMSASTWTDSET